MREQQRLVAGQRARGRAAAQVGPDNGATDMALSIALIIAGALAVLGVVAFGGRARSREHPPDVDADLVGAGSAPEQVPTLLP